MGNTMGNFFLSFAHQRGKAAALDMEYHHNNFLPESIVPMQISAVVTDDPNISFNCYVKPEDGQDVSKAWVLENSSLTLEQVEGGVDATTAVKKFKDWCVEHRVTGIVTHHGQLDRATLQRFTSGTSLQWWVQDTKWYLKHVQPESEKSSSLANAARWYLGFKNPGDFHNAQYDAKITAGIWEKLVFENLPKSFMRHYIYF